MEPTGLFDRYRALQRYVGWSDDDAGRVASLAPVVEPRLGALIDDFYSEIDRHPDARRVITGGAQQIERLKGTLIDWLRELLSGRYDADYVARRWRVGSRHVEIGLEQVYTNVGLSRLRAGLIRLIEENWNWSDVAPDNDAPDQLLASIGSLNRLLDLDLAIIEDAYQAEYMRRQQQTERLAAIGQVAGGVAHELRNPLNVIKTSVYFLLNARNPAPGKIAEHLERIEKQVGLADGVITALSNFAKLPLPNMHPIEIETLLRETLENIELPADIEVHISCPESLPPVLADAGQMQIVFGNLIRNARDAMPDAGRLVIAAKRTEEHLEISISDSGHGIEPENFERIMEPLYSTKARGIGLGLPMARAIVQKNSGELNVESQPGRGATFIVRLPAAALHD